MKRKSPVNMYSNKQNGIPSNILKRMEWKPSTPEGEALKLLAELTLIQLGHKNENI